MKFRQQIQEALIEILPDKWARNVGYIVDNTFQTLWKILPQIPSKVNLKFLLGVNGFLQFGFQ
jgi:hypothetical protein